MWKGTKYQIIWKYFHSEICPSVSVWQKQNWFWNVHFFLFQTYGYKYIGLGQIYWDLSFSTYSVNRFFCFMPASDLCLYLQICIRRNGFTSWIITLKPQAMIPKWIKRLTSPILSCFENLSKSKMVNINVLSNVSAYGIFLNWKVSLKYGLSVFRWTFVSNFFNPFTSGRRKTWNK